MEPTATGTSPDEPTNRYKILIKGHLNPCWAEWFEDMALEWTGTGETIISGEVADQAALQGLLNKIFRLNLPLISVKLVEPESNVEACKDE